MSYISEIRQKIGHELLIYLGAGVIVYRDGKVLLQERKDNGKWALHAGGLEIGEELEDTARRELLEETGLAAGQLELLGVYSGKDRFMSYPNGDKVYMPGVYFICQDFSGELHPQLEEVRQLKWFNLENLPENIHEPNRRPLEDFSQSVLKENKKNVKTIS